MSRKGMVYYRDILAGTIEETDEGYEFAYVPTYLETKTSNPVSLTLPLTKNMNIEGPSAPSLP